MVVHLTLHGVHSCAIGSTFRNEWCTQQFTGSNVSTLMRKLPFNATVYYIWQERNRRLFQSVRMTSLDLVSKIIKDIRLSVAVLDIKVADNAYNRSFCDRLKLPVQYAMRTNTTHQWRRPGCQEYMINSDGSLAGNRGGFATIIRDHEGVMLAAAAGSVVRQSVVLHELQGVEMGVKLAKQYGLRKITLGMDSSNAHMYLNTDKVPPWKARHTVRRIKNALTEFEEFTFRVVHVFRETNQAADKLASTMPSSEFMEISPSSFAQDLKDIIHNDDAKGKNYARL